MALSPSPGQRPGRDRPLGRRRARAARRPRWSASWASRWSRDAPCASSRPARLRGGSRRRRTSRSRTARRCSARWRAEPVASATTSTPPTPTPRSPRSRAWRVVEQRPRRDRRPRPGPARGRASPTAPIDVGNAGTLMRLLPGLARRAGRPRASRSTATTRSAAARSTASPSRCAQMGASDRRHRRPLPPFTVTGAQLHAIDYELPVASAQVKSCVLLAALAAEGATTVTEPAPSRDHTERMLAARRRRRPPRRPPRHGRPPTSCRSSASTVPGDPSSAAFFVAAGVLVPGSRLLIAASARTGRAPASCASPGGWGRSCSATSRTSPATRCPRASRRPARRRPRPARRHHGRAPTRSRWPSTSSRWWRCWAASPRATPSWRAPTSCA